MIYIVILPLLFICLFTIYELCKDDFLLIRRDVKLSLIFNYILLSFFVAFITARIVFIIDSNKTFLINPLLFFHLINYGGLSIFGGFLGGVFSLLVMFSEKKIAGRMLDISSLAFYPFLLPYIFLKPFSDFPLLLKFIAVLLLIVIFNVLLRFHKEYSLKDGSIFLYVFILFSSLNIFYGFFNPHYVIFWKLSFSQFLSIFWILFSLIMFILRTRDYFFKKT